MFSALIIDADTDVRHAIQSVLEPYSFQFVSALTGKEGLEMAATAHLDLIFVRIELPNGSGFSVFNRLRKNPSSERQPVILYASTIAEEVFDRHRKLRSHAEGYLRLPLDAKALVQTVGSLLDLPEVESPPDPSDEMLDQMLDEITDLEEIPDDNLEATPHILSDPFDEELEQDLQLLDADESLDFAPLDEVPLNAEDDTMDLSQLQPLDEAGDEVTLDKSTPPPLRPLDSLPEAGSVSRSPISLTTPITLPPRSDSGHRPTPLARPAPSLQFTPDVSSPAAKWQEGETLIDEPPPPTAVPTPVDAPEVLHPEPPTQDSPNLFDSAPDIETLAHSSVQSLSAALGGETKGPESDFDSDIEDDLEAQEDSGASAHQEDSSAEAQHKESEEAAPDTDTEEPSDSSDPKPPQLHSSPAQRKTFADIEDSSPDDHREQVADRQYQDSNEKEKLAEAEEQRHETEVSASAESNPALTLEPDLDQDPEPEMEPELASESVHALEDSAPQDFADTEEDLRGNQEDPSQDKSPALKLESGEQSSPPGIDIPGDSEPQDREAPDRPSFENSKQTAFLETTENLVPTVPSNTTPSPEHKSAQTERLREDTDKLPPAAALASADNSATRPDNDAPELDESESVHSPTMSDPNSNAPSLANASVPHSSAEAGPWGANSAQAPGSSRREQLAMRGQLLQKDREILELREELDQAQQSVLDERKKMRDVHRQFTESQGQQISMEQELVSAQERANDFGQQLLGLQKDKQNLQSQVDELQQGEAAKDQELQNLRSQLQSQSSASAALNEELSALQESHSTLSAQLDTLRADFNSMREQKQSAEEQLNSLRNELSQIRDELSQRESTLSSRQQTVERAQQALAVALKVLDQP